MARNDLRGVVGAARALAGPLEAAHHAVDEARSGRAGDLQQARLTHDRVEIDIGIIRAEIDAEAKQLADSLRSLEGSNLQVVRRNIGDSKNEVRDICQAGMGDDHFNCSRRALLLPLCGSTSGSSLDHLGQRFAAANGPLPILEATL